MDLNGTNPYNTANNHLNTSVYEARGSITSLGSGSVAATYDGENRLFTVSDSGQNTTWIYDAEGQRAQRWILHGSTTVYVHDAFGKLAAEYNSAGVTPACVTCYLTYDMLGTPRMITNESQYAVARHDYTPFGEDIPDGKANRVNGNFGISANVTQGFTGQESDSGSGALDYFNARTLSVNGGAFMQADPGNAGADVLSPQSWNGYAYVLGNPLGLVDPSGLSGNYSGIQDDGCPPGVLACVTHTEVLPPPQYQASNPGVNPNSGVPTGPSTPQGDPGGSTSPSTNQTPPKNGTCPAGATASGLTYSASVQQHIAQRHMYYLSNGAGAGSTIPSYNSNGANVPASQYMFEPDGTPAANWQLVLQINAKTFSLATPVPSRGNATFTAPLGPQNIPFPLARPFIGVEYGGWLNIFGLKFPFPALPTDVNTLVTKADCQTVVTSHPGNP